MPREGYVSDDEKKFNVNSNPGNPPETRAATNSQISSNRYSFHFSPLFDAQSTYNVMVFTIGSLLFISGCQTANTPLKYAGLITAIAGMFLQLLHTCLSDNSNNHRRRNR